MGGSVGGGEVGHITAGPFQPKGNGNIMNGSSLGGFATVDPFCSRS